MGQLYTRVAPFVFNSRSLKEKNKGMKNIKM